MNIKDYNIACVFQELSKLVINAGGRVSYGEPVAIKNNSILYEIYKTREYNKKLIKVLYKHDNERLKKAVINAIINNNDLIYKWNIIYNNSEKSLNFLTWNGYASISFIIDGIYYHYNTGYLSDHFIKTPVIDNKISMNIYAVNTDDFRWFNSILYKFDTSDETIKERAYRLYMELTTAPMSRKYTDTKRVRRYYPAPYSNRYYYETIIAPEKWASIKF